MERAIIVVLNVNKAGVSGGELHTAESLKELNDLLSQGWTVKQSSAMGGTANLIFSSCLVILEKK
jgi:hypothetical protein